jgi:hypothetical protein
MIEYRHNVTEAGMNGSKERFSACSVGTSMLFTIKVSGLIICKLIRIEPINNSTHSAHERSHISPVSLVMYIEL